LPLQVIALDVEEDEVEKAGLVAAADPVGLTRMVWFQMRVDGHRDGGNAADGRLHHLGSEATVHQAGGAMPEQVGDMRTGEALDERAEARADARQGRYRREERE